MDTNSRHILLLGFKHVGKSSVGRLLARQLGRTFYDLDEEIECTLEKGTGLELNCREIVSRLGEVFFRAMEGIVLKYTLDEDPAVVALGGGAVMAEENRALIRAHIPVHITAPQDVVRERVVAAGWPHAARFDELWNERDPVYRELAQLTVENTGTIESTVNRLVQLIKSNIG